MTAKYAHAGDRNEHDAALREEVGRACVRARDIAAGKVKTRKPVALIHLPGRRLNGTHSADVKYKGGRYYVTTWAGDPLALKVASPLEVLEAVRAWALTI